MYSPLVKVRAVIRMSLFFGAVILYFLTTILIYPILKIAPWKGRKVLNQVVSFYCRIGLKILAIKPQYFESNAGESQSLGLFVANHLSYLDILILSAKYPSSFVTSVEIKQTFFLGKLCELAGCVFVERRSRDNLGQEVQQLTSTLNNKISITIFPEGTSTNGESVLRFRRPLFQSVIASQVPVCPITINYDFVGDEPFSIMNRDQVLWYGDMEFLPHLWSLCHLSQVTISIHFHPKMLVSLGQDLEQISTSARNLVASQFRSVRELVITDGDSKTEGSPISSSGVLNYQT